MNPDENIFEKLSSALDSDAVGSEYISGLVRPNGEPVPVTWSVFTEGEHVVIKDYTFEVVRIGETYLVLEPVGPIVIEKESPTK